MDQASVSKDCLKKVTSFWVRDRLFEDGSEHVTNMPLTVYTCPAAVMNQHKTMKETVFKCG
jgi:hypothetical protein